MSKISTLVGTVVDGIVKTDRIHKKEEFYTLLVDFKGCELPVLFSSYTKTADYVKDAKVQVTGCIMSDVRKGQYPKFYFYANQIDLVDIDSESTNTVNFSVKVTKVGNFTTTDRCTDILSLATSDKSPFGKTSVLFLVAKNQLARKLKGKEPGFLLVGNGKIKPYKDIYEIYIDDVENLDDPEETEEHLNA